MNNYYHKALKLFPYLFFLSLLFYFFYHHFTVFPPVLFAEEGAFLTHAIDLKACSELRSLTQCLYLDISNYKKGFSWFVVFLTPLIHYFFDNIYSYEYIFRFFILLFPLSCIFIAVLIFKKVEPRFWLISAVSSSFLTIYLVSFWRYKWHTISLGAILAIYILAFYFQFKDRLKFPRIVGASSILLFCFSVFFYMPSFFIIIAFFFVLFLNWRTIKSNVSKVKFFFILLTFTVFMIFALYLFLPQHLLFYRLTDAYHFSALFNYQNLRRNLVGTYYFFRYDITIITFSLLLIGILRTSYMSWRTEDYLAKTSLFMFLYVTINLVMVEGFDNHDYTNFIHLPILMMLMHAVSFLMMLVDKKIILKFILLTILVGNSYLEATSYEKLIYKVRYQGLNSANENKVALIIRYILSKRSNGPKCYLLPSEETQKSQGGFGSYFEVKRYISDAQLLVPLFFATVDKATASISLPHKELCSSYSMFFNSNFKPVQFGYECIDLSLFSEDYGDYYKVWQCKLPPYLIN